MGLDTTHDCWHGPYSAFMRWRRAVAKAAGVPLDLMEGFHECPMKEAMAWAAPRDGGPACDSPFGPVLHRWCEKTDALLPIAWESLRPDPIHVLLMHSDCDGDIAVPDLLPLAERLDAIAAKLDGPDGEWAAGKARQFAAGLRAAAAAGENVEFH